MLLTVYGPQFQSQELKPQENTQVTKNVGANEMAQGEEHLLLYQDQSSDPRTHIRQPVIPSPRDPMGTCLTHLSESLGLIHSRANNTDMCSTTVGLISKFSVHTQYKRRLHL